MFFDEFEAVSNAAATKVNFLKSNPLGYFCLSALAGIFVGFGVLLAFSIGGFMQGIPSAKVIMGLSFGIALSLVVIAGAELFTGNNFVMSVGMLKKKVSLFNSIKLWAICFFGNWIGAIFLAILFHFTGLCSGPVAEFIASSSAAKINLGIVPLITRGILCNILVCLAVWCGFKCKSDSGKLIMIIFCLFAFVTTGFEHSIANMTLLTISLIHPCGQAISLVGYFYNLFFVTIGNILGGAVFLAFPYFIASKQKQKNSSAI